MDAFENPNAPKKSNAFKEMGTIKNLEIPESIKDKIPTDIFDGSKVDKMPTNVFKDFKIPENPNLDKMLERIKKDDKILQSVIDKNETNVNLIKNHFKELSEEEKEEILKDNAYSEILKAIPFNKDTQNIGRD